MKTTLCAIVLLASAQFASAQVITNEETERGLRMPNTIPFDGEPWTQRYSYGLPMNFAYINGNSRQLWDYYWQDRIDRAAKFGYEMPKSYEMQQQPAFPRVRAFFAEGGFGIWRR